MERQARKNDAHQLRREVTLAGVDPSASDYDGRTGSFLFGVLGVRDSTDTLQKVLPASRFPLPARPQ